MSVVSTDAPVQTADRVPSSPLVSILHRVMWSCAWDLFIRVVNLAWAGWMLLGQIVGAARLMATSKEQSTALFLTSLGSRLAVIMYLSLLLVAVACRTRPLAKSQGLWSRVMALAGSFIPTFIVLLPRNEEVVLVNLLCFTMFAVGYGLTVYSLTYLNRSFSIMPEARRLVTGGPYRFIRHPVYLFEQIGIVGLFLPYWSIWAALMLAAHMLCQYQRMLGEERVLRQAFPEYQDYARQTARLIPGIF